MVQISPMTHPFLPYPSGNLPSDKVPNVVRPAFQDTSARHYVQAITGGMLRWNYEREERGSYEEA